MSLFVILNLAFSIYLINIRRDTENLFVEIQNIDKNIAKLQEDYNDLQLYKANLIDKNIVKKYINNKEFHLPLNNEVKILKLEKNVNSK